jgi:hypothetical protein
MRRTILAAVAVCALAQPAFAEWAVVGLGTTYCDEWTEDSRLDGWPIKAKHAWLGGFVSGENSLSTAFDAPNVTDGTDFSAMTAWIDNYCAEHPAEQLGIAAQALTNELRRRQQQAAAEQ